MVQQDQNVRHVADRSALGLSVPLVSPGSKLQIAICAAFVDALGVSPVGMDDDFFDLGGDSLNAETLSMLLSDALDQPFRISSLLDHSSPRRIEAAFGASPDPISDAQPTQIDQNVPFFLVHGKGGYTMLKPTFRKGLGPDRRVEIFELPGLYDDKPTPERIEALAGIYVAQLLALYPSGPIFLTSFCAGGLIAVEMAQQLQALGRPVAHLVLIDPGTTREMELRHTGRPDALLRRILLAPLTGRFSGVVGAADFEDDRLLRRRVAISMFRKRLSAKLGNSKRSTKATPAGKTFKLTAKEKLRFAYRHYWPKPFSQHTDIIASAVRNAEFIDPKGHWARMLPNCTVHQVLDVHSDLSTELCAATLESIFANAVQSDNPVDSPKHVQLDRSEQLIA